MAACKSVVVLCPNGRRQTVKVNPTSTILQVLKLASYFFFPYCSCAKCCDLFGNMTCEATDDRLEALRFRVCESVPPKSLFCSFMQVLEEVCKKQVLSSEHYALQLV